MIGTILGAPFPYSIFSSLLSLQAAFPNFLEPISKPQQLLVALLGLDIISRNRDKNKTTCWKKQSSAWVFGRNCPTQRYSQFPGFDLVLSNFKIIKLNSKSNSKLNAQKDFCPLNRDWDLSNWTGSFVKESLDDCTSSANKRALPDETKCKHLTIRVQYRHLALKEPQ